MSKRHADEVQDIASSSKRARIESEFGFLDLCDDVLGEVASFLVRPIHYKALLMVSTRLAHVLTRPVLRTTMTRRYFVPWRVVVRDISQFRHVAEQTPELCLMVVCRNGWVLRHVKVQTQDMCNIAVYGHRELTRDIWNIALYGTKEPTQDVGYVDGYGVHCAFAYVQPQFQTRDMCLYAVERDGNIVCHVHEQTEEICLAAVWHTGYAIMHVREQTEALCIAAVQRTGLVLEYVTRQTEAICLAAVKQNGYAFAFVDDEYRTPEIRRAAEDQLWRAF